MLILYTRTIFIHIMKLSMINIIDTGLLIRIFFIKPWPSIVNFYVPIKYGWKINSSKFFPAVHVLW